MDPVQRAEAGTGRIVRSPRRSRRLAALGVLALLAPATGCYNYAAVEPEALAPEQDVRVRLTPLGVLHVRQFVFIEADALTGRVARSDDEGLHLDVVSGMRRDGMHMRGMQQRVVVPRAEIAFVEERDLDRTKTAITAAAVGAGLAFIIARTGLAGRQSGADDGIVDPAPAARIPLFRIPLP
jgi:hypothetical protein